MQAMKRNERIQLHYQLAFTTPFHCGTGLRVGLIDRTIVRDRDGYLYVPGSTLKGILRERCEQLARLYEELDPEMLAAIASPHDEKRALWALEQQAPTMITRIFGSHSFPGRLFFDDARQTDEAKQAYDSKERGAKGKYKAAQVDLSTQARLDRPTGMAVPGALYTSEFGVKDLVFEGQISGWLECLALEALEKGPTYSLLLLLAGLHLLDRLGGNKSTGKGQCQCTITHMQFGEAIYKGEQLEERLRDWLGHLEALSYYSYAVQEEEV